MGGTLRVAMTMGDIPLTTGQPGQGGQGQRFIGITVDDALINWDLSRAGLIVNSPILLTRVFLPPITRIADPALESRLQPAGYI